jgi:hypothetical protein
MRLKQSSVLGAVLAVVLLAGAHEARAQGSNFGPFGDAVTTVGIGAGAGLMAQGLITGVGSSVSVARGRPNKAWFISSYVLGTLNLGGAAIFAHFALDPWSSLHKREDGVDARWAGMAIGYAAVGLWNLVMPTLGFIRGTSESSSTVTIAPVLLRSRDAAGRRWTGVGLQVANF